ncbi:AraC family transcriptional regulator [Paenochrobactrum gallinarii]|uniref:AraC family transcriptional regulator n=1 Tax=Paenochrobactrum gallinarii TaxID=643673 RepID=A0A841M580_9HYPH|nr:AraC family transcriptional regulator [Paenochrobactrum gallinarii]MBB6260714.1 AraC family transcriptional regulator [Paenochrobactrum gallinarii]
MSMYSIHPAHSAGSLDKRFSQERQPERNFLRAAGERCLTTTNGKLTYAVTPAGSGSASFDDLTAIIIMTATRDLHWKTPTGRNETFNAPAGTILVIPADTMLEMSWAVQKEHLVVKLDAETLQAACEGDKVLSAEEYFPSPARFVDAKCLQVAHLLRAEMQKNGPVIEHYLDALRTVFVTLLLQNHSVLRRNYERQEMGGLSYHSMRQIENYLRDNFCKKISVTSMANFLGVSPGHFLTSFRESFGQTPHQYLLMLRLNEAERRLQETDESLADIADKIGFSSQSHMTTALKKNRSTTPGELRRMRFRNRETTI